MKTFKEITLIFFVGLGLHRFIHDILRYIDPEFSLQDDGYFTVISFMVLYFTIRYFKQKDEKNNTKEIA